MSTLEFCRSTALNNIPIKKVYGKLLAVVQACEVCSKKEVKTHDGFDGLCPKCALHNIAFNRYQESNIPIEYWDLKMEKDFVGNPMLLAKYNDIVGDIKGNYIAGTSICFSGLHGLGKTMTATCILKKAAQKGYTCLYTNLSDIVNTLTQAPSEDKFEARRELLMVDFLVIDEFDSRFMPSENAADLYARTLEVVFRTRSANKQPTFMCTNSPNVVESFSGAMKESIDSLLKGYLKTFPVFGEDFRKKK